MPADLSVLLRDAAEVAPVPELDLDDVRREVGRRSTRRRARTGGALLATVVVAAGATLVVRDGTPAVTAGPPPTAPTPQSDDPGVLVRPYATPSLDDRVVVGGSRFIWSIDAEEGSSYGLESDDISVRSIVGVGDRVVWSDTKTAWSMSALGGGEPVALGLASAVAPAIGTGRVWLVRGAEPMQEVWLDGSVQRELELPVEGRPVREVVNGMLVDVGGRFVVVGFDGRQVLGGLGVRAASATTVLSDLGSLVDVTSGEIGPLSVSGLLLVDIVEAAFSPDGSRLAVFTGPLGTRRAALHVVDLPSMSLVQRHRMQSVPAPRALQWSTHGDAVYLLDDEPGSTSTRRIVGVPLGGAPQTVATIAAGADVGGLAVLANER